MFSISYNARIFFHGIPVDLRNGFDGLSFLAASAFKNEMLPNTHFVFINPRRTRMKVLSWNGDNLVIRYIRLRKGVFCPPCQLINIQITRDELHLILDRKTPKRLCLQNHS
jgi:transposase